MSYVKGVYGNIPVCWAKEHKDNMLKTDIPVLSFLWKQESSLFNVLDSASSAEWQASSGAIEWLLFEKTKPILGKVKSKKAKGKM